MTNKEMQLISRAQELRAQADASEAAYKNAVREAHVGGWSLRALANALGVSHQTINNIVKDK